MQSVSAQNRVKESSGDKNRWTAVTHHSWEALDSLTCELKEKKHLIL